MIPRREKAAVEESCPPSSLACPSDAGRWVARHYLAMLHLGRLLCRPEMKLEVVTAWISQSATDLLLPIDPYSHANFLSCGIGVEIMSWLHPLTINTAVFFSPGSYPLPALLSPCLRLSANGASHFLTLLIWRWSISLTTKLSLHKVPLPVP